MIVDVEIDDKISRHDCLPFVMGCRCMFVARRLSGQMAPFDHPISKVECAAIDGERTVAPVMHHSTFLAVLVDPDPRRLKDEEVVRIREPRIDDPALDIGQAVAVGAARTRPWQVAS